MCQICLKRLDQCQVDPIGQVNKEVEVKVVKTIEDFNKYLEAVLFDKFPEKFISQKKSENQTESQFPNEAMEEQITCCKCQKDLGPYPKQSCPKCGNLFHQKCYPKKGEKCPLCKQ
jgi:hypothetical protein